MDRLRQEIEKKLNKMDSLLTPDLRSQFFLAEEEDLEEYNYGFGTLVRLKLLGPKSPLYKQFLQAGYSNRDQITLYLLRVFHRHLHACREASATSAF